MDEQYWIKRLLHDSAKIYNFAEGQLGKLRREYEKAIKQIDKDLRTVKQTERLDKLKARLLIEINRLMGYEEALTRETLLQVYAEGFYRSSFNIQQALGYGTGAIFIAPNAAEVAIGIAWSGKNYSERIWQHRDLLAKKVEQTLTQGTILGHSNAKMAQRLAQEMDNTFANAARLVRTETNYIHNQASKDSYSELGVEQYQFLAVLDLRTSVTCASLDGKNFDLKKAQAGVNYPPMHPNCRSTTIPVVGYDADEVRLAKINGTYYEVPATMTYEEWYNDLVKEHGADKIAAMKKMEQNVSKDRQQHATYKKELGIKVPQSFADFQRMKYNDSNQWATLKKQYRAATTVPAGAIKDPIRQQKHAETYYEFIRKRKDDVAKIAKHTGWKESAIQQVKEHVFLKEHMLQGKMQRFYPDYEQAQAWQRLIDGKKIKDTDYVFLKHEFVELTQMRIHGYSYEQAHDIANKHHNWQSLI